MRDVGLGRAMEGTGEGKNLRRNSSESRTTAIFENKRTPAWLGVLSIPALNSIRKSNLESDENVYSL